MEINADGNILNVSNLEEDIEITVPGDLKSPNFTEFFTRKQEGNMGIHQITVDSAGTSYSYDFRPQNDRSSKTLTIYIRYSAKPTKNRHDYIFFLPNYTSCNNITTNNVPELNCADDSYLVYLSSDMLTKLGTYFMGVEVGQGTTRSNNSSESQGSEASEGKQSRTRRDCMDNEDSSEGHRIRRSCIKYKDPPPKPTELTGSGAYVTQVPVYNRATDLLYSMRSTAAKCVFWNEATEGWSSKGCKVR